MDNLNFYNQCREVPDNAKKAIGAGRLKGMTDINPMWRIRKLTEMFGPCGIGWYYDVTKKWIEPYGDERTAFVDIDLYIKVDGEWSKPICGTGGSMFVAKEKSGLHVSDECYKMATTDAISVACKRLGVGADVYWSAGNATKYDQQTSRKQEPEQKYITQAMLNTLASEMKRTGIGGKSLLNSYGLRDYTEMTVEQFRDAMEIFKKKLDKNAPPKATEQEMEGFMHVPEDDDYCGLPFN